MVWGYSGAHHLPSKGANERDNTLATANTVFSHSALQLYQHGASPAPIPIGKHGILFGYAFDGHRSDARVNRFAPQEAEQIIRTDGQYLLQRYWGGYVAVWVGVNGEGLSVLRDPSGMIPCYYAKASTGLVLVSDVKLLKWHGISPEVDWHGLSRFLFAHELKTSTTSLQGICELLPGQRLRRTNDTITVEPLWTPWSYTSRENGTCVKDKAAAVAGEVDRVVRAWRAAFQRPLLSLSGGLDSSILAAALARSPSPWSALNMGYTDAGSDETRYARDVARAVGVDLACDSHRLIEVDTAIPSSTHQPRPLGHAFGQSQARARQTHMESLGTDVLFVGEGGDNVFCYMQSATPVVDRFISEGLRRAARTAVDVSDLTRTSLWTVWRHAFRRWRTRDAGYVWAGDTSFFSAGTRDALQDLPLAHEWLQPPADALPGAATHIAMLLRIQGTLDAGPGLHRPTVVAPLLSQPLLEMCVGIPSWHWCRGGINRAPVRDGFAGRLPLNVLRRVSKGGANAFCMDVVERDRLKILARLRDGLLADRGLLDRDRLRQMLESSAPIPSPFHLRLSLLAEAEAWARYWQTS